MQNRQKDFVHKLHTAQKECDESLYWAELLFATQHLTELEFQSIQMMQLKYLKYLKAAYLLLSKE